MSTAIQRSFSSGELSPSLGARVDLARYPTGLETCRNMIVRKGGGIANRPGLKYICETAHQGSANKAVRLIPFIFNDTNAYTLIFGDGYIRFVKNGALLRLTPTFISGATQANPVSITDVAHGYSTGDEVYITDVVGMTQLNGRQFKIVVTSVDTYTLRHMNNSTGVNGLSFGAYTSGGQAEKIYQVTSTYLEADLQGLDYAQSADVMTIVHPSYKPRDLTRFSDTSWTLVDKAFNPSVANPVGVTAVPSTVGTKNYKYRVTAIAPGTFEESLPSRGAAGSVTTSTNSVGLILITTALAHGYTTGDEVIIAGNSQASANGTWGITVTGGSTFTLNGSVYVADGAGGTHQRTHVTILSAALNPPPGADTATVTIPAQSGVTQWNVYRADNGIYGYVGNASAPPNTSATYVDYGYPPDFAQQPPTDPGFFQTAGNYPAAVTYHQQRIVFARSNNEPETVWMSRTGSFKSFSIHSPLQDDDAVVFSLVGQRVVEILHMAEIGRLVLLTSGSEHSVNGDESGAVTPTTPNVRQQSSNGSSSIKPLLVNDDIIYGQARGTVLRSLIREFVADGYRGNDISVYSDHLLAGHSIRDMAFQTIPGSVIWIVRDDGALIGCTYLREHEINGWHRHDTDGVVEQVCVVPEGSEDAVYVVVKRDIPGLTSLGGSSRRYVERFATRDFDETRDGIFADSALTYDGRDHQNTPTMTITLDGAPNWESTSTLKMEASLAFFVAGDVGNAIDLTGSDGETVRFTIETVNSTVIVHGKTNKTVPASLQAIAIFGSKWEKAVKEIGGLWHLEGESLAILGDAMVVASPNHPTNTPIVVTNGIATLDAPYAVIQAGLPYLPDVGTLDLDTPNSETMVDKQKLMNKVTVTVLKSKGLWAGTKAPSEGQASTFGLNELKGRNPDDDYAAAAVLSQPVDIPLTTEWNRHGHVFLRQIDPLPLTVLAIAPAGFIPLRR